MPQENEVRENGTRKNSPSGAMSHTRILGIFVFLIVFVAVFPQPETRFYKSRNIKSSDMKSEQLITFLTFKAEGKSIAFLPCCGLLTNNSLNHLNTEPVEYFFNSFYQMPDLLDIEKKQYTFTGNSVSAFSEIADKLRVDYTIELNMERRKRTLRLSANMVDVLNDSPVFYKIYSQDIKDKEINEIMEDIAISIINDCKEALGKYMALTTL